MAFTFGNTQQGAPPFSDAAAPVFLGAAALGQASVSADLYSYDGRSTPPPLPGGGGLSSFADHPSAPAATAATATAFSFGASTAAPTAAATTVAAPLFSSAAAPSPAMTTTAPVAAAAAAAAAPPNPSYLKVPEYNATFPGEAICKRICQALAKAENGDAWAGQELVQLLMCNNNNNDNDDASGLEASVGHVLLMPLQPSAIWKMESENPNIRQQLSTQQMVVLHNNAAGRDDGVEAMLSHNMLNQVLRIADDLCISEQQALTLYAQATSSSSSSSSNTSTVGGGVSIEKRVQDSYFRERRFYLQTVLHLMQHRLRAAAPTASDDDNNYNNNNSPGGGGDCVLQATDQLLQNGLVTNLMHLIRNYSVRIVKMMQQLLNMLSNNTDSSSSMTMTTMDPHVERQINVLKMHLQFGMQERQRATECLFFIAYSTQLEPNEVAQLIDLIRDLTNGIASGRGLSLPEEDGGGMPRLDPFKDVPDAYENSTSRQQQQQQQEWTPLQQHQQPFYGALPQRREKDPFKWQTELIDAIWKSGQPELLRSVSTLTMTVVAALDTRNTLLDRNTHAYNTFGAGNALLPPGPAPGGGTTGGSSSSSTQALAQIHARLDRQRVEQEWQRPDVLGILLMSYSLLLLRTSAPSVASSSPSGGGGGAGAAAGLFGGAGSSSGNIDVRGAWRMAIEAPLELKSFSFARQSLIPALQIPSDSSSTMSSSSSSDCNVSEFLLSVLTNLSCHALDILVRYPPISRSKWLQDAEEDLSLRRSNQEQHRQFHNYTGTSGDLEAVPSSVDLIQRPDCMDDVLAFCVEVSRLDASYSRCFWTLQENVESSKMELQLTRAVSQMEKIQVQDDSLRPCYLNMLASLAMAEGSDLAVDGASKIHQLLASPNGEIPTQWTEIMETLRWYARELVQGRDSGQSRSSASSQQSTRYYYFDSGMDPVGESMSTKKSSSSSGAAKSRELGETNTMILQSHLSLIVAVALRSADARAHLRALTLPVQCAEGVIGADSMMMVLFTLAATPISPELRGQVFECLGAILVGCTQEESLTAWQLVESSGIIPIWKLEQYPTDIREDVVPGLSFPPSSTARIVADRQSQTWIPDDPTFALIYEMEYIEAASGMYPSTVGFLRLLRALVVTGGCPSTLGDNWRVRAGCSPYIEYVLHLVLPRIMGTFSGLPPVPFRSLEDKNRLLSTALEVVEVCITRYVVPMPLASATDEDIQRSFTREKASAEKVLGLTTLVDGVVVPATITDSKSFIYDFRPIDSAVLPKPSQQTSGAVPNQRVLASPLPLPKSPGFLVLAEALIGNRGSFFDVLAASLCNAVASSDGADADRFALCYALFGATPPTVASTKIRKNRSLSDILGSLQTSNRPSFDTTMKLRHKITAIVLNILCAAASREENLQLALTSSNGPTNIIPVLRFQAKCSTPKAIDLQLSRVGQLLSVRHLVTSVVECIGFDAGTEDTEFSATSVALYFYIQKLDKQNLRADLVSSAFARRIWSLSEQCFDDPKQAQLLRMILDRVLLDLRRGQLSPLLGSTNSPDAGFDAIIGILKSANFVASPSTSAMAASCYEIAYLTKGYLIFSELLSSLDFWATHFSTVVHLIAQHHIMLGTNLLDGNVSLSVAWILKGLAGELRSLLSSPIVAHVLPATRPMKYKRTLSLLFDEDCFIKLVYAIPVDQPVYAAAVSESLHIVLGGALLSCAAMGDTIETSQIINALVYQLSVKVHPETARNLALCIYLATIQTPMAGEGIGRLAVVLADAIGIGGVAAGILSSALEISLGRWTPTGGIPDQAPFLRAATALIRLSCQVSDGYPIVADSDTIMARSCLKVLLRVLDEKTAHRLLTDPGDFRHASPLISTLVKQLSKLDSNVPFLLHTIALLGFGTDLLFEADVLGALTAAAEGYTRHESEIKYSTFQSQNMKIGPPPFWSGHLKLMSLMIAGASGDRKTEIAGRVINILSRYEVLSTHILSRFPSDGEEALAFSRCCALAHGAVDSKQPSTALLLSVPPVTGYRAISGLTMHIAENPLPTVLQTPLPAHLMSKKTSVDSDVVAVCQEDSTWWDKLALGGTGSPNLLQVYQYGIVGCQLVKAGLCVIRSSPAIRKIDSRTLSHAICKCTDAVRFVDSQSYHRQLSPFFEESNGTEVEAQKLRAELLDVVSDLLRVTLMCVRQRNWISEWEDARELISFALDHTQLDSRGLAQEFAAGDENRPDYVKEAAMSLRNSLA